MEGYRLWGVNTYPRVDRFDPDLNIDRFGDNPSTLGGRVVEQGTASNLVETRKDGYSTIHVIGTWDQVVSFDG
jgi:hypothetical protein